MRFGIRKFGVLTEGCTSDIGPQSKGHTLKEGKDDEEAGKRHKVGTATTPALHKDEMSKYSGPKASFPSKVGIVWR